MAIAGHSREARNADRAEGGTGGMVGDPDAPRETIHQAGRPARGVGKDQ